MSGFLCGAADVIPLKFQKGSGVLDHNFRIKNYQRRWTHDDFDAWSFELYVRDSWMRAEAPILSFAAQVEALAILASLTGETERAGRYINVHAAYEAVVSPKALELSAIRHALAHPITSLTRPNVLAALRSMFGTSRIDLHSYAHQKILYCAIGAMLIAVDDALFQTFSNRLAELIIRA